MSGGVGQEKLSRKDVCDLILAQHICKRFKNAMTRVDPLRIDFLELFDVVQDAGELLM
jgi:hypothetical protein